MDQHGFKILSLYANQSLVYCKCYNHVNLLCITYWHRHASVPGRGSAWMAELLRQQLSPPVVVCWSYWAGNTGPARSACGREVCAQTKTNSSLHPTGWKKLTLWKFSVCVCTNKINGLISLSYETKLTATLAFFSGQNVECVQLKLSMDHIKTHWKNIMPRKLTSKCKTKQQKVFISHKYTPVTQSAYLKYTPVTHYLSNACSKSYNI